LLVIPVDPDLSGEEPESICYLYGFRVKHGMTVKASVWMLSIRVVVVYDFIPRYIPPK